MTFHWPHAFWLLLLPLALFAQDWFRRRSRARTPRTNILQAEAGHSAVTLRSDRSTAGAATASRVLRFYLYLGLALSSVALARPQWGRIEEPVFDQAREILVALDLSRSMLAQDVRPSRLARARLLVTSLLERLKGERVGLVVFAGTAFLQTPLSSDYEILNEFLPVLEPGYLPEGGTNFEALIDTSLTAFGASGAADRFLIVLSDGEAQTDGWRKHIEELKTKGIRVISLGVGTGEGAMIPDGAGAFVKDERGAVVLSKLTSTTLRELAEATNGAYADASSWVDVSQLLANTVEQGRRGEFKDTQTIRLAERFQWPLAAAVLLLLLSFWREFPVRPKPRAIRLACAAPALAALLALGFIARRAEAAPETDAASAPVTELVGRLAATRSPTADDYANLARATTTYGEKSTSAGEPIGEGIVRDGLAAIDAGEALDARATDWSELRKRLNALLKPKTPPQKPKEQPKPDQQKPEQNQPQDRKDKKNDKDSSEQKGGSSEKPEPSQQKPEHSQKKDGASSDSKSESTGDKSDEKQSNGSGEPKKPDSPSGQSAFGDMKDKANDKGEDAKKTAAQKPEASPPRQPQPNPGEMQQVGGTPADATADPARLDPNLALPLQRLDRVKEGDSPARLFQLLQEPSKNQPPAPKGKDW